MLILTIFGCSNFILAQSNPDKVGVEGEFYKVDISPQFPGGIVEFLKYVSDNLEYPKEAKEKGIEGQVYVSFIVDETGTILQDSTEVRESLFYPCDQEAIRLINEGPKWIPGRISEIEKNVPVRMTVPILFRR